MKEYTFLELQKLAKHITADATANLLVMGDCSTQYLSVALKGLFADNNLSINVIDTDYNQLEMLTLNSQSDLYSIEPRFVLIHMCTEKLLEAYNHCFDKQEFAKETIDKITNYWCRISNKLNTNIIQFTFPEIQDLVFGNYGLKVEESFAYQLKLINYTLIDRAQQYKNVFLVDMNEVAMSLGMKVFRDAKLYYSAKMPLSLIAVPYAATRVAEVISAIQGKVKKCVICDLDNTLWGG